MINDHEAMQSGTLRRDAGPRILDVLWLQAILTLSLTLAVVNALAVQYIA
jgi:hypothetical protein